MFHTTRVLNLYLVILFLVILQEGYSSFHYVSMTNNTGILRHLLTSSGSGVNSLTHFEETPLHLACLHGHLQSAELLSAEGADLRAVDVKGNTVLHFAAASDSVTLVNWITCTEEGKQLIHVKNKVSWKATNFIKSAQK